MTDAATLRRVRRSVLGLRVRLAGRGRRLPPGRVEDLDASERRDREFLLKRSAVLGPIFRTADRNGLVICVVGHVLGRRLLAEHAGQLQAITLDLEPLFSGGFMRQMQGDAHRVYRKALVRAIGAAPLGDAASDLAGHVTNALDVYERDGDTHSEALHGALDTISTRMLVQAFFGAPPGSQFMRDVVAGYHALGRHGLVWNPGADQVRAFQALQGLLRDAVASGCAGPGVLARAAQGHDLDDALLGNLIYMVEMGRYDLHALLRWLVRYFAIHPELAGALAEDAGMRRAFVLETLRTDQSERLMRKVLADFTFEGFAFPRAATVRVCMWEAHKAPGAFRRPLVFDPAHFLDREPEQSEFSPFGLDHHTCPVAGIATQMAMVFVEVLARDYDVVALGDGAPIRGAYHWEPASAFSARITRRTPR